LGIPYTASRVLANALSLDKTQTKRIWQSLGLPTAHFQEFHASTDVLHPTLRYPMFVKPAREGTGMGMGLDSIVYDETTLREQVAWVIETYQQPALVEEFLSGREFTVGFIGNRGTKRPFPYNPDGYYFFHVLELGTQNSVSPGVYGYDAKSLALDENGAPDYLCPADIPHNLRHRLYTLTRHAAEAIGVCDVSRVDFRLDDEGEPYLLEINTLPGLNPAVSDLCIMARADDIPYQTLITEILYLAAERFGLLLPELALA
jgi:D-alanine-D-alanine ligase